MKVVITGGAGFIGSKLVQALLERGTIVDSAGGSCKIEELVILDMIAPSNLPDDPRLKTFVGQANDPVILEKALVGADSVFHFASVVSGGAEADLQLGLSVNLDGTRMLLDILADSGRKPKLIFASSGAVYGGGSALINDDTAPIPQSSYGVQKLCCEFLIGDYSRRGLIDGRSLRFPTIGIRPGKPNKANSSFISNIIREPLAGKETVCPVPLETEMTLMSPDKLVQAIQKVHDMGNEAFGWPRALLLPAIKVSVKQLLDALEERAGKDVRARVLFERDEGIISMVKTWPANMQTDRAKQFAIEVNSSAMEIVDEYIQGDFGKNIEENVKTGV